MFLRNKMIKSQYINNFSKYFNTIIKYFVKIDYKYEYLECFV